MLWPTLLQLFLARDLVSADPSALHYNQKPLVVPVRETATDKLHGRFLHITDFHPDPFFKVGSSASEEDSCHHGTGSAGYYGAEVSDCDSPKALVNATFDWLKANVADDIDFIVWTGDSARHDNDETLPRNSAQVRDLNRFMVSKFDEVFGRNRDNDNPYDDFTIPIVPNIGNNDILPHNIFDLGPNYWTRTYLEVWRSFIPEEQRHEFDEGGWYAVDVIPNHLTVFSLNTMYFFSKNAAVDGCSMRGEPGYRQMEWLRVQLQFLRERGMKAMIIGHVPPARTEGKSNWDETCWQKYAFWMRQYRDVVVGSIWGHMNIDHFIMQDFEDIDPELETGHGIENVEASRRGKAWDQFGIKSASSYVQDLRTWWSRLPKKPKGVKIWDDEDGHEEMESSSELHQSKKKHKGKKGKKGRQPKKGKERRKYLDAIGGQWAERFSVAFVSPSIVPNYFPSYRIFTYNISGITHRPTAMDLPRPHLKRDEYDEIEQEDDTDVVEDYEPTSTTSRKKKKKKRKDKNRRKRRFTVPHPPAKGSPPGPAYSPQPLSLISYKQYYANLTWINNATKGAENGRREDVRPSEEFAVEVIHGSAGKHDKQKAHTREFEFQVLYDTADDKLYEMHNELSVRLYVDMADRISEGVEHEEVEREAEFVAMVDFAEGDVLAASRAQSRRVRTPSSVSESIDTFGKAKMWIVANVAHLYCQVRSWLGSEHDCERSSNSSLEDEEVAYEDDKVEDLEQTSPAIGVSKDKKEKRKRKKHRMNDVWHGFLSRAFVGSMTDEEIRQEFGPDS